MYLEIELRKALNKEDEYHATSDGMDIALLNICTNTSQIYFAGAQRPLIHIHEGKLVEIKGTKRSIGHAYEKNIHYKTHSLKLEKGDCLYMFSDGYQDQFGEESGKKFMKKQVRELLTEITTYESSLQKRTIESTIDNWKGNKEQTDDILIMGLRLG